MKGWYGNRHRHALASKGVRTTNGQYDYLDKMFHFKLGNSEQKSEMELLEVRARIYAKKYDFKYDKEHKTYWKKINDTWEEFSVYGLGGMEDKEIIELTRGTERKNQYGTQKYKSTLNLRKNISKLEKEEIIIEEKYRKLRRGIKTQKEIGFENLSKKDAMKELEISLNSIRSELKRDKKDLESQVKKMKDSYSIDNKNKKTIYNTDNYPIRRTY